MQLTFSLHKARREHPKRTAIVCGDRRTTYEELARRVGRLAGSLQALGVKPGDRIGILAPDSDRYLEFYYAVWWVGAVPTPVNYRLNVAEIAYALEDCGAQTLVIDDPFVGMLPALRGRVATLATVIYLGFAAAPDATHNYDALLTDGQTFADVGRGGSDAAALFYTGGTTGKAKGVLLSHGGLHAVTLGALIVSDRLPDPICLHGTPLFHVAGFIMMLQAMMTQSTLVMLPAFDPGKFLELIERERVSKAALVPTMIKRVVDHPVLTQYDLSSWKQLHYGASPIDATLLEHVTEKLPGVALTQYYGMTETSSIAVALPDWCHRSEGRARGCHRGAGFATPCAEMRVVGPDGNDLPHGDIGEVWLRGPGVMLKYWNQPELTAQAVNDGWMRTGDAGYVSPDGLLFIVDRLKDMIISGGENIYSVEVENAILSLEGVAQCAVIGVPDPVWGERVHAVLVLQPNVEINSATVIDHCKRLIAGYKCPRSVEFRKVLPISGAGKLLKYKLREPYWANQARGVA
jgi:acyl-CoA synthetase (AMP-forming)/AMP-acid ligase II